MDDFHQQIDFSDNLPKKRRWRTIVLLILVGTGLVYSFFWLGLKTNAISIFNFTNVKKQEEKDRNYVMPQKEEKRIDILIMGIRGKDDPDADTGGAYLTDTMVVFSYEKITNKSSLISIPRDLYVKVYEKQQKINAAYADALARKEGLDYVKNLISQITGVYIDHAAVIDFSSFEQIIDELGGVDVMLDKPFKETTQWGYEFDLSAGQNHLDGQDALYYARSRYSTNDFDRARRQQQIIFAIKNKLLKIDFFSDPARAFSIFNAIKKNTATDIGLWDIKTLFDLAGQVNGQTAHYIISTENLLHESSVNDTYILLPNDDNFDGIKNLFQETLK